MRGGGRTRDGLSQSALVLVLGHERLGAGGVPDRVGVGLEETGGDTAGSTGTDLGELNGMSVGDAVLRGEGCDAVIVARPPDGTVTAFHAVCPHRQIVVERDGGQWRCPAHGARFDTLTGAVLKGPASSPLPPVDVQVVNGRVVTRS